MAQCAALIAPYGPTVRQLELIHLGEEDARCLHLQENPQQPLLPVRFTSPAAWACRRLLRAHHPSSRLMQASDGMPTIARSSRLRAVPARCSRTPRVLTCRVTTTVQPDS